VGSECMETHPAHKIYQAAPSGWLFKYIYSILISLYGEPIMEYTKEYTERGLSGFKGPGL
jgi:hypothetical protein